MKAIEKEKKENKLCQNDCKFTGAAGAIGKSEKIARMKYSNELYTETRDLADAIYSKSKSVSPSDRQADKTKYENLRTGISGSFKRSLEKYNYRDIEAYNFNDDNDENVSFAIAKNIIYLSIMFIIEKNSWTSDVFVV